MDIIVCVKRVPLTQDVDLEVDKSGKDVQKESLEYFINEWDNYAIEEAVQLREKFGGTVKVLTVGDEDDEEVLRRCLAIGADSALRIDPGELEMDSFVIARLLSGAIKEMEYDLILTGVQADDNNNGMVGILVAEYLGIGHSAVVTGIDAEGDAATVRIELEGGMNEVARIRIPALLTIQTGINEPRYVSIMGIRKASKKELIVKEVSDLNLSPEALEAKTRIEELYLPPETEGAEMIEGDPGTIADEIIRIMKEKGVNI